MATTPAVELARVELEQLKGTFLSNLNHEIRTPLSGILGMADLLKACTALEVVTANRPDGDTDAPSLDGPKRTDDALRRHAGDDLLTRRRVAELGLERAAEPEQLCVLRRDRVLIMKVKS